MGDVTIRKFNEQDIKNKVRWINDSRNNKYLHYDLPLDLERTKIWFESIKGDLSRFDAIICYKGQSVGVIGLININEKMKRAEYYITIGENDCKGKGIATKASKNIIDYGFNKYDISKIWLTVDADNIPARRLYEKIGMRLEAQLKKDIYRPAENKMIDRCIYGITREEWEGLRKK